MDVGEDAAHVVGAEAGGQGGEARVGGFVGDRVAEAAAVAEEDAGEVKKEVDARKRCLRLFGSGVLGWFGGLRRLVHGRVTNIAC